MVLTFVVSLSLTFLVVRATRKAWDYVVGPVVNISWDVHVDGDI